MFNLIIFKIGFWVLNLKSADKSINFKFLYLKYILLTIF